MGKVKGGGGGLSKEVILAGFIVQLHSVFFVNASLLTLIISACIHMG